MPASVNKRVVCSIREPEGGAPGNVLLWLEHNGAAQDPKRAILLRNAAFTLALNRLQNRRVGRPETVSSLMQPMDRGQCGNDRPGFGVHSLSQKLSANNYKRFSGFI